MSSKRKPVERDLTITGSKGSFLFLIGGLRDPDNVGPDGSDNPVCFDDLRRVTLMEYVLLVTPKPAPSIVAVVVALGGSGGTGIAGASYFGSAADLSVSLLGSNP